MTRTLWDLIDPRPRRRPDAPRVAGAVVERPRPAARPAGGRPTMRERYDELARRMLTTHRIRVRKWRSSMSGVAWQVAYADGAISRLIEAPRPRGPMSCAVFLHEIGHHVIGFGVYRPRCLEEYHAWRWALETMQAEGLNVTDAVRGRMAESLEYAVWKARRRGLKRLPAELEPYRTARWERAAGVTAGPSAR